MLRLMNRRRFLKSGATTLFVGAASRGALAAPTRSGAADDMAVVRAAMDLHPGLHRYNSPRQITDRLALLQQEYRLGSER